MIVKPHAFIPYRTRFATAMRHIGGVGYSILFHLFFQQGKTQQTIWP